MIQRDIERALAEYIGRKYTAGGSPVATGTPSPDGCVLTFTGALAPQTLAVRPGETMLAGEIPAVQIVCQQGEDDDLGNERLQCTVSVIYPADPDSDVANQLTRLATETDRLIGWLFDDGLPEDVLAVNVTSYGSTILGVPSVSAGRSFDEHRAVSELTLTLYCAGMAIS